jgi:hypothetical protein
VRRDGRSPSRGPGPHRQPLTSVGGSPSMNCAPSPSPHDSLGSISEGIDAGMLGARMGPPQTRSLPWRTPQRADRPVPGP